MYEGQLKWRPVAILLGLALIWGANMAVIKLGARELPPLFMAGVRSLVAGGCLFIWMRIKNIPVFPSRAVVCHGIVVGLMFGLEFGFVYVALGYTLASRTYICLYTAPFFAALGAHFFLKGDHLTLGKSLGLLLAFTGVVLLFANDVGSASSGAWAGDFMAIISGLLWAATTIYLKKFLTGRSVPLQTLFYQVFFSAPLLLLASLLWEEFHWGPFSLLTGFSVFYQCIIVAFLSYLAWFALIHRYPASLLHGFSFFTPVFGVLLSGVLILGEAIPLNVIFALVLVCAGMILVNRQSKTK